MTRAYGSMVAGLAMAALMGAGARLEPVEEDFDSRRAPMDPEPSAPEPEPEIVKVDPPNDGEGIPNRLSIQRDSRYYTSVGNVIGLIFDGEDVTGRVVEFDREGGWARLVDRKLSGKALSLGIRSRLRLWCPARFNRTGEGPPAARFVVNSQGSADGFYRSIFRRVFGPSTRLQQGT